MSVILQAIDSNNNLVNLAVDSSGALQTTGKGAVDGNSTVEDTTTGMLMMGNDGDNKAQALKVHANGELCVDY